MYWENEEENVPGECTGTMKGRMKGRMYWENEGEIVLGEWREECTGG